MQSITSFIRITGLIVMLILSACGELNAQVSGKNPNPAGQRPLTIELNEPLGTIVKLPLVDPFHFIVFEKVFQSDEQSLKAEIPVKNLAEGVYILRI